ncbi:MAG: hypothetical protein DRH11_14540 [Deltaproteobacteria bacterium]|nr:MAG: hypothetical protein DRH11_14540 [Deltaproteobacteria bacterium]
MRYLKTATFTLFGLMILFVWQPAWAKAPSTLDKRVTKKCMNCHKEYKTMKDILAGEFKSRSRKAKSIQVKINGGMQLVKYTPETSVKNVPNVKALKAPIPIRVHYRKVGNDLVATKIVAKPKMKVPEKQLMKTEELARLVALGPKKGGYTLVDSRPGIKFAEGHIPTSISIPFPKMSKMKDRLPKDKNSLLIFYCGGMR